MGDQHLSEKRKDRQGQISLWRMFNNHHKKRMKVVVEQPAIGSQRDCEGRTAEGRLARWCPWSPVIGKTMGNHGTPQIARGMERGVHNESSVAANLRCCTYCMYCNIMALLQITGRSSDPQSDRPMPTASWNHGPGSWVAVIPQEPLWPLTLASSHPRIFKRWPCPESRPPPCLSRH